MCLCCTCLFWTMAHHQLTLLLSCSFRGLHPYTAQQSYTCSGNDHDVLASVQLSGFGVRWKNPKHLLFYLRGWEFHVTADRQWVNILLGLCLPWDSLLLVIPRPTHLSVISYLWNTPCVPALCVLTHCILTPSSEAELLLPNFTGEGPEFRCKGSEFIGKGPMFTDEGPGFIG